MPYQPKPKASNKKFLPIPQVRFPKGYISILTDSRIPPDGLAEMYNMTLEQDSIPRPRPGFKSYGQAFLGTCIGMGTFTKWIAGVPQKWEISMQVISGVAKICVRKDGGSWSQISGSYTFDTSAWNTFTQGAALDTSNNEDDRVYISNGVNNMAYYDITGGTVVVYTGLSTPSIISVTASGSLIGTNFNQYYRITAVNVGGESAASPNKSAAISTDRDFWTSGQSIALVWPAVTGALYYNIYTSNVSGEEEYLVSVNGTTFTDDGSILTNPFKVAPNNDSSAGPIVKTIINIDNALYGVGDPNNTQYLWYSGSGQHFGDFSFNPQGGGYVGIDFGGSTHPVVVFPFHDGKGNPAPSVLTHGAAGRGKLMHIQFTTTTIGTTTLTYPTVYEASSQDGCPSPRGVAIYNNNAYYCTGTAFKTTGTKPNVINILATDTISNQILPDVQNLNLAQLPNYVAHEYLGKIYFAMPTSDSTSNNEIWVLDLTRGGLWILRWVLATSGGIDHMWLYEDNSGSTHFLILQNNMVLELDLLRQSTPTTDNGQPFNTVLRTGAMVFDQGGVAEVASYIDYLKLLYPQGEGTINVYGLTEDNVNGLVATDSFNELASTSPFIWGQMLWSNPDPPSVFSGDTSPAGFDGGPGTYSGNTSPSVTIPVEIDEILSEKRVEITTATSGCDYLLSSITSTVYTIPRRYAGNS